jgi:hypothetical protein
MVLLLASKLFNDGVPQIDLGDQWCYKWFLAVNLVNLWPPNSLVSLPV